VLNKRKSLHQNEFEVTFTENDDVKFITFFFFSSLISYNGIHNQEIGSLILYLTRKKAEKKKKKGGILSLNKLLTGVRA
jgi:hypothetical protein